MKTATFGAFVIAAASLFATGTRWLNRAPEEVRPERGQLVLAQAG